MGIGSLKQELLQSLFRLLKMSCNLQKLSISDGSFQFSPSLQ